MDSLTKNPADVPVKDSSQLYRDLCLDEAMLKGNDILSALPAAVYTTDASGLITFYNPAAVELWGIEPVLGDSTFCGSWKLYWADGRPMRHDECPMALALKERRAIKGAEAVAERPDGTRVPFLAYPTPLFDSDGSLSGAVNTLVDITSRKSNEEAAQRLAAIIEFSDDAILATDLEGTITNWNRGAERLFGYTTGEVVGRPVTMLLPPDRQDEEPAILARIRRGEHIEHYETVRQPRDGSLVDISLTVSPVKNAAGTVVGMSKIARDITDRRRAQDQQRLLLSEMNHRVKNLLVLASSVVSLSARSAKSVTELASDVRERLVALARAHQLTLPRTSDLALQAEQATTLHALIQTITSPFVLPAEGADARVRVSGSDVPVAAGGPVTSIALLLHEFVTNAAKYGALSTPEGRVDINSSEEGDQVVLTWTESGGPAVDRGDDAEGFGGVLARATVKGQLEGTISREWRPNGLFIRLSVTRRRLKA
ncbi:putative sensory transduction histidine kinase [alpha proteobacterium BAL199]|nr:putative sensory transduction histidine kinase [alpha proteobacterium BAL199]